MELRRYAAVVWRWMWLIVLLALGIGAAAFVRNRRTIPVYRASATLMVTQANSPVANYSDILAGERLARTYSELLQRRSVLTEAISELGLEQTAAAVQVDLVPNTQLIQLTVRHPDPSVAMLLANKIPVVFRRQNEELQTSRFAASKASLLQELERLSEDIGAIEAQIAVQREASSEADQEELRRLETNLTQYRSSYASLLRSYEEIRLAEATVIDNVVVVEPAHLPMAPTRPRILQNTALAALLGAMLGLGVAFLIDYLDDTVKTEEDVREAMNLGILGAIGRIPGDRLDEKLVTIGGSRSPLSEAYRVLRTNLQFADVDHPPKTLLVTSAGPSEGKSTTVANLAAVMAQAGSSVILVDSDLRRPLLNEVFLLDGQRGGLTNALMDGADAGLEGYLQETQVEGLRVLASGAHPPNPSELLGSDRMKKLIERLKDEADLVLFDSPPTLVASDAAVLATQLDGVLMVVDTGATRRDVATRAVESLRQVGAKVYGVVMNRLSRRQGGYYYYYYHHYYSEEGEGDKARERGRGSRRRRLLDRVARRLGLSERGSSRRG